MSIPKLAGIETEYAISGGEPIRASTAVVQAFAESRPGADDDAACVPSSPTDFMLANGARLYVDHAHPEYSTPEAGDPAVVAMLDRAGSELLRDCTAFVNSQASEPDRIRLYKNNSDHFGRSYGCHENYLMEAPAYTALFGRQRTGIDDVLIPFLVSRIVYTGAGKVGAENGRSPVAYQLSQRADFFEELVGLQTTHDRPIVNTRDEPHADPSRFRRLHVIAGDANMCPFATWLKVGTMQIVLRMLEDGAAPKGLQLRNPIEAVVAISHDPSCAALVELEDGRRMSALDIQSIFMEAARGSLAGFAPSDAERAVLVEWEKVLVALRRDPMTLAGTLDWVTKRLVIGQFAGDFDWSDARAQEADLKYHALDPVESIYQVVEDVGAIVLPPGWSPAAVERAKVLPPDDTRASLRGECIRRFASRIRRADWSEIVFESGRLTLANPFLGTAPERDAVLAPGAGLEDLLAAWPVEST